MTEISDNQTHQGHPGLKPELNFDSLRAAPTQDGEGMGVVLKGAVVPGLVASEVVFAASVSHRKEQSMTWPSCSTGTDPGASNTIPQPQWCAVAYLLSQPDSQVVNKCIR